MTEGVAPILGIIYKPKAHLELPHVVKFSGGRSSGMMLIALLDQGLLKPERGDVVLFNNTSAEHPATYEFVRKCTEYTEHNHGIPFFWLEHTSYEDAINGEWARQPTFRLVNSDPYDAENNPDGYHWRGEVFEEMVSLAGFLPSRHSRICTTNLKLFTTNSFLSEWFAAKESIEHKGHHYGKSMMSDEGVINRHRKNRGKTKDDELLRKKSCVRQSPPARPAQNFSNFSEVGAKHLPHTQFAARSLGDVAPMKGPNAIEYISLIGLRGDEPLRVARVKQRNMQDPDDKERRKLNMPDGEIVYMPLADAEIDKEQVLSYWENQPWKLVLPDESNLSNCVFCFMKGGNAIPAIRQNIKNLDEKLPLELRSVPDTPSDIEWWVRLEEFYQRRPPKHSKKSSDEKVTIGFWGVDAKESYRLLKDIEAKDALVQSNVLPCDCTD